MNRIEPFSGFPHPPTGGQPPTEDAAVSFGERIREAVRKDNIQLNASQVDKIIATAENVHQAKDFSLQQMGGTEVHFIPTNGLNPRAVTILGAVLGKGSYSEAREATHIGLKRTTSKTELVFKSFRRDPELLQDPTYNVKAREAISGDLKMREQLVQEGATGIMPLSHTVYQIPIHGTPDKLLTGCLDKRLQELTHLKPAQTKKTTPSDQNVNIQHTKQLLTKLADLHNLAKRRHGDIKEKNIFFEGDNLFIGDVDGAAKVDGLKRLFQSERDAYFNELSDEYEQILSPSLPTLPSGQRVEEKCKSLEQEVEKRFAAQKNSSFFQDDIMYICSEYTDPYASLSENIDSVVQSARNGNLEQMLIGEAAKSGITATSMDDFRTLIRITLLDGIYQNQMRTYHFQKLFKLNPRTDAYINQQLENRMMQDFIEGKWESYREGEYKSDVYAMGLTLVQHFCGYDVHRAITSDPQTPGAEFPVEDVDAQTFAIDEYVREYNRPEGGAREAFSGFVTLFADVSSTLDPQTRQDLQPVVDLVNQGVAKIDAELAKGKACDESAIQQAHNDMVEAINRNLPALNQMGFHAIQTKLENLGFQQKQIDAIVSMVQQDPTNIPDASTTLSTFD